MLQKPDSIKSSSDLKSRYSVFGSLVHFIWVAKFYKSSGFTGQIKCLQNILTQMQFPAQKAPRLQIIGKSNQWTGHSMLVTLLYHFCQAHHKVLFSFTLSTLNSVSIDVVASELPSYLISLMTITCKMAFQWCLASSRQSKTPSTKYRVKQVFQCCWMTLHTAEQQLEHRLTFWSCYAFISNHGTLFLLKK